MVSPLSITSLEKRMDDGIVWYRLNDQASIHVTIPNGIVSTMIIDIDQCDAFTLDAMVDTNARLDIALIGMNAHDCTGQITVTLLDHGQTNIRSCFLGNAKKQVVNTIIHRGQHTVSTMEHYGLINTDAPFNIEAIGRIEKKANDAQCHQALRALTFASNDHVTMIPSLYIDNYDCAASHSTSIGQISPKQLYYLQSRGLTMDAITLLLAHGYIQPVLALIDDETIKNNIQEMIEKVVIDACTMKTK